MKRMAAFFVVSWTAAAILLFSHDSVSMLALSGVVAFGGLDLLRP
ncbi:MULTISPECIES: hypothetical protein [Cupriavidus]|nr:MULTISPECIES: hypothetical protein [Cupriavidus]